MANLTSQNPIIIDTAGAGVILTRAIAVNCIRWVGATTAGHTAIIQDASGIEKWAASATATNLTQESLVEAKVPWVGLIVPTLASGKLYIYTS